MTGCSSEMYALLLDLHSAGLVLLECLLVDVEIVDMFPLCFRR